MTKKPLQIPHRSRHVPAEDWVDYPRAIHARWQALAVRKGFRIDRRVRDRLHLALECAVCGAHIVHKLHTLRTAQPACLGCQADKRANDAKAAGFELLSRDEGDRHYNLYRLPCGHDRLLQTGLVTALLTEGTIFAASLRGLPVTGQNVPLTGTGINDGNQVVATVRPNACRRGIEAGTWQGGGGI